MIVQDHLELELSGTSKKKEEKKPQQNDAIISPQTGLLMFSHSPHPHLRLPGDGFMVVLAIAVKSGSFLERGGGGTEEEKLAGCRVFLAFPRTAAAAS